jgi:glucokinase
MTADGTTIGVDLGGTKILVAPVEVDGTVGEREKMDTPRGGPDSVVEGIVGMIGALDLPPLPVGIGTPGMVRPDGTVVHAPNLAGWEGEVPLGALLRKALPGRDVTVDNDVNAATLGEHRHGAAAGRDDVLCVFVGTGVGGGMVLDGHLRRGPRGMTGEIGHVITGGDRVCGCGMAGHLEAYAGRRGLETEARRRIAAGEQSLLAELAGDDRMKSGIFLKAWEAGDPLAVSLIDEAVQALAVAMASSAMLIDLDLIVVGGGLAEKFGARMLNPLRTAVAARVYPGQRLDVVTAALGDNAGVVGAAGLVSGS